MAGLELGQQETSFPPSWHLPSPRPALLRVGAWESLHGTWVLVRVARRALCRDTHACSTVHTRGSTSGKIPGGCELGNSLHMLPLPHPKDHYPRRPA